MEWNLQQQDNKRLVTKIKVKVINSLWDNEDDDKVEEERNKWKTEEKSDSKE